MPNKFEQFCNNAVVFCYCALIYFLPISIALVESFSGGVIFFYVLKKISRAKNAGWRELLPQGSFLSAAMAGNIFVVFVSIFFSKFVTVSLFAFFAKFLQGCFLYYSFVECFRTKKQLQWFMGVLAASAVVICFSGLYQYWFNYDFVRGVQLADERMSSTFRQANDFGAYLIVIAVLALAFMLNYTSNSLPKRAKAFLMLAIVLAIVCLGATYSRSSWVGFSVAAVLVGVAHRRVWYSLLLIVCLIGLFTPLMTAMRHVSFISDDIPADKALAAGAQQQAPVQQAAPVQQQAPVQRTAATPDFGASWRGLMDRISGMGRLTFWEEAIDIIKQFPVFGAGLNTYSRVAPGYKISWGGYPHNCYLQMAAEVGLIGLFAFLFLLGTLFVKGFKALGAMHDPFLKAVASGSLAGLLGFLLQSSLDTTLYSVQLANFMWIMMGLGVAAIAADQAAPARG